MGWKPLLDEARWVLRDDPERAAQRIDEAIHLAEAEPEDEERLRAFVTITGYLADKERWAEASALQRRVLDLLREHDASADEIASALARRAEMEKGAGDPQSAAQLYEEALELWRASAQEQLTRAVGWYEDLAEARREAEERSAASAAEERAHELRIEANGSYYQPRVMRHARPDGAVEYAVHDVYFTIYGHVDGYTQARSPRMPSVAALRAWIEETLPQAAAGVKCGDLGYTHDDTHLAHWLRHIDEDPLPYEVDDDPGPPSTP